MEKEYQALMHYRKAASQLCSAHLISIEHVNRLPEGLFYVMPLADGMTGGSPEDVSWSPMSLAERINHRAAAPSWFTSEEITDETEKLLK